MKVQNLQGNQLECDDQDFAGASQVCSANSLVVAEEDIGSRKVSIALVSAKDQRPENCPGTIRQFIEALKIPDAHNFQKDGPAFLQGPCPSGGGRSGIEAFELFGFDVDDGDDPEEVREWCEKLGLAAIIYPCL